MPGTLQEAVVGTQQCKDGPGSLFLPAASRQNAQLCFLISAAALQVSHSGFYLESINDGELKSLTGSFWCSHPTNKEQSLSACIVPLMSTVDLSDDPPPPP